MRLTVAQQRALTYARDGYPIAERGTWSVETSFMTGAQVFGVPRSTLDALHSRGLMDGLAITPAGRLALASSASARPGVGDGEGGDHA